MSAENNLHKVISVRVVGFDVEWNHGPICSIEYRRLKAFVIAKAVHVDEFVKAVRILDNHQVFVKFDNSGAEVEVVTLSPNGDLFGFKEKLQIAKAQFHSQFISNKEFIQESNNFASAAQPKVSPEPKQNYAAKESIQKLLTGPTGARIEIDFGSKKEMAASQSAPIHRQILDMDVKETLTGEVGILNEIEQKVTFCNIDGVRGMVTLDIVQASDRKRLLLALLDYRKVVVVFAPYKDSLRPDMQARSGKLISIEAVGDANEKLL